MTTGELMEFVSIGRDLFQYGVGFLVGFLWARYEYKKKTKQSGGIL